MRFAMIRLVCAFILAIIVARPAVAQSPAAIPRDYDPNFSYDCGRACLDGYVDQYLAALVAHDPSRLPLARQVKFTENGQELKLGDGLWGTATGIGNYKIYADDPQSGEVMFMGIMLENGAPIILNLRLKVELRRITEIETVIARKEAGSFARPENLVQPNPLFAESVPPSERRSRENMIAIANSYFSAIEKGHASYVPFDKDCNRVESGVQTTNSAPPNSPAGTLSLGCEAQIKSREFQPDTLIRDRRFLVVDEERGLVLAGTFFDHDAKLRSFTLADGRVEHQTRTAPWSWEIAELFKIEDGKIMRIEAIVNACPYGMKSGW
ncbi:MAG TPA: hypothetical protein VHX49_08140 [Candidatus Acidoferrales bacterium]|jgi:hypothetical protein|nr:hypothetical protein [Candidatus Acidoferrales bacterium]